MVTRAWRRMPPEPARAAGLAAVVLVGVGAVASIQAASVGAGLRSIDATTVGAVVLACLGWSARRTAPSAAALAVAAVVAGYLVAGGPYGPIQLVASWCCFTVGAGCTARRAGAVGAVVAVVLSAGLLTRLTWSSWYAVAAVLVAFSTVFVVLPLLVGVLVRVREEGAARQRSELLARGAESERLRLAQEVHDVAGHGFAVVSMQAGVALTVFDEQPDQARRCLEAVRDSADSALRDLHGMLGALRAPAPTITDVPELVTRVRAAGLPVELRSSGEDPGLDETVSATVHRVVQEALTNVLRHAGPTVAQVEITHDPDAVTVVVRDHGTGLSARGAPGSGHGLDGLRARAGALGGTLAVTDRPAGGVEVEVRLPRRATP